MKKHYTPAEWVIKQFKGVRATARLLDRSPSSVCRWPQPAEKKGLDGRVPGELHQQIIALAQRHNFDITASDIISGRTIYTGEEMTP